MSLWWSPYMHHGGRAGGIRLRRRDGPAIVPDMSTTGRCLCGEITYEIEGDPLATVVCHCEHCQRQSGGAFSVNVIVMPTQIEISGELKTYVETGENDDGEYVHRKFCGSCGSPIVSELLGPGMTAVKAGTLDDRSAVAPTAEVWCVDRQPWVELPGMTVSMEREG